MGDLSTVFRLLISVVIAQHDCLLTFRKSFRPLGKTFINVKRHYESCNTMEREDTPCRVFAVYCMTKKHSRAYVAEGIRHYPPGQVGVISSLESLAWTVALGQKAEPMKGDISDRALGYRGISFKPSEDRAMIEKDIYRIRRLSSRERKHFLKELDKYLKLK